MFHISQRLLLRPGWPEDAAAIAAQIADEAIVRNLVRAPWPYGRADAEAFARLPQDARVPHFLVELPGEGVIGSAGFGMDGGKVEIGYWLGRRWWGNGFATEAAFGLVALARLLGHDRLAAGHFTDNPASGEVLRKVGFVPTGTVDRRYSVARQAEADLVGFSLDLTAEEDPVGWKRAA